MSNLGGNIQGKIPDVGFQSTTVGAEVALQRRILRKAFRSNNVKKTNGIYVSKSTIGPFRSSLSLGDNLSRKYQSCGAINQVNNTYVNRTKLGGSVSNVSCSIETNGVTPLEVPLESGNSKYVSDSSLYTRFKHLESRNKLYNDSSSGGSDNNSVYMALKRVR